LDSNVCIGNVDVKEDVVFKPFVKDV